MSSLRREAVNSLPAVGAAVVSFILAALVEGYVSASSLPYWAKASVALLSAATILGYLALGDEQRLHSSARSRRSRDLRQSTGHRHRVATAERSEEMAARPTVSLRRSLLSNWMRSSGEL